MPSLHFCIGIAVQLRCISCVFVLENIEICVSKLTKMLQLLGDFVPQTPYRGIALDPTGDPALKACV